MSKNRLVKTIMSLGVCAISTPIFACICNDISTNHELKVTTSNADTINKNGIILSKYLIEGWNGSTNTFQVLNNDKALTSNVTLTVDDSTNFAVSGPDGAGNCTISFKGTTTNTVIESKVHVTYIDSNKIKHASACIVRLLPDKQVTTPVLKQDIKLSGTTTTFAFSKSSSTDFADYEIKASDNASSLSEYTFSKDKQLSLSVTSKTTVGSIWFTIYHKDDASMTTACTVVVNIVDNDLKINVSNISARLTDETIEVTPTINGSSLTSKDQIKWEVSDPQAFDLKIDDTTGKANLCLHKVTTEPVKLICYDALNTSNYKTCYVNITNSYFKIGSTKPSYKIFEKQTQLSITLDEEKTFDTSKVVWKTSNEKVAAIDKKGLIKFIDLGKATITAIYTNTNGAVFTDTFECNVVASQFEAPESITALLGEEGKTITAKIDGTTIPSYDLMFTSDDENVVTVDSDGKLTYKGVGTTIIHTKHLDYLYVKDFEAVTTVTVTVETLDFKLSWTQKTFGLEDLTKEGAKELPKATYGVSEVDPNDLKWECSSAKFHIEDGNKTFYVDESGDYQLTCTYIPESIVSNVTIHVQDFFINDYDSQEPTIEVSSSAFINDTLQLNFYFDKTRTDKLTIQSCESSNTNRVEVDNNGLMTFRGHGHADITCKVLYKHINGEEEIKTATVHVYVKVPIWMWIASIGALLTIIGLGIVLPVCLHKKHKKQKGGKSGKPVGKSDKPKDKPSKPVEPEVTKTTGKTPYYDVLTDKELVEQLREEVKKQETKQAHRDSLVQARKAKAKQAQELQAKGEVYVKMAKARAAKIRKANKIAKEEQAINDNLAKARAAKDRKSRAMKRKMAKVRAAKVKKQKLMLARMAKARRAKVKKQRDIQRRMARLRERRKIK